MLPIKAKRILAANLRILSGGTDTQAFRLRVEKKSGVSARTIGYMLSESSGNPTLANLESVADALGVTIGELLTENLGRSEASAPPSPTAKPSLRMADAALSHTASRLTAAISLMDQTGNNTEVFSAIETLLRHTLPPRGEPARGSPEIRSMLEQFARDPDSLEPEAIALLRKRMGKEGRSNSPNEKKNEKREHQGGTGT